ncbi:UDP-N-acetylmuramoyl-L-alanine--D-glutamate ligase [Candidatus Saccharibacteria bacterium]|nr:UDP-N-acetylmuramoyl-L-alanine--D-glutamate ligase [Candidatus Saccharibacteria bacterium]
MNILILGYGVEGKSVENFFKHDSMLFEHTKIDILDNFKKEELLFKDFSKYDLIFRTPSIPPKFIPTKQEKLTSATKYFFSNCPAPIIGITGTKGKGTTCTLIRDLLKNLLKNNSETESNIYLVGNIGTPALDILPELKKEDVVIYELSSFQLWDLKKSPSISVILRIEPDHLDVHDSFEEYLNAKENIVKFQKENDFCIYFKDNKNTEKLIKNAPSKKLSYPVSDAKLYKVLQNILDSLSIPGPHNRENAEAALMACYAFFIKFQEYKKDFSLFLEDYKEPIKTALKNFRPLPHHLELVRTLNNISYYDDSFSTVLPSLEAAINSFPKTPLVLILGGKDKGFDMEPAKRLVFDNPYLVKAVLIGETAKKLSENEDPEKFFLAGNDFEKAIKSAQKLAEEKLDDEEKNSDTCLIDAKPTIKPPVVILSPCASSFDMFKNYKERGDIFKKIVNELE